VVLKIIPSVRRRDFSLSSLQFDLFFNIKNRMRLALTCRNGYDSSDTLHDAFSGNYHEYRRNWSKQNR